MRFLLAALRKDLLLTWRSRAQAFAVFVFGATTLLLFSFAVGPDSQSLAMFAGGFLWLGLLLSSTLTLAESFRAENEQRALEGLLLIPSPPPAIFYGKALSTWFQLASLGFALIPVMVVLYDPLATGTQGVLPLLGVVLLGSAGLAAPGTFYSAMASQTRAQQVLLPLLLFPLVVPVLLASVKATSLVLRGDPMGQIGNWVGLLIVFNGVYWPLCGALFGQVVEE